MPKGLSFDALLWGLTFCFNAALIVLLFSRKNHRVLPLFSLYVFLDFVHGLVVFESYRIWGFTSYESINIAWGTQGVVTVARAMAVAEICHSVLAKFKGVWKLAWRTMVAAAVLVFFYSWAVSRGSWRFAILNIDRGLELAIASSLVFLFLFAKYYEVAVEPVMRTVATGFFLYSGFRVLNDTILERWLHRYAALWNVLGTATFLATLLLWIWALRLTQKQDASEPELLSEDHYRSLSPAINARLKSLNERLVHFWDIEGEKT